MLKTVSYLIEFFKCLFGIIYSIFTYFLDVKSMLIFHIIIIVVLVLVHFRVK